MTYQPKTGRRCTCKRGVMRDNCPQCEGTGWDIDYQKIRENKKLWWTAGSGRIELQMTLEDAENVSHPGRCDDDVDALVRRSDIRKQLDKINPEVLKEELFEYGAWDENDLKDHEENLKRIIWIAGGDIINGRV